MFDISLNRTPSTCNLSFLLFLCDDVMKYYPTFRINFFFFLAPRIEYFNRAFSLYYVIVYFSRCSFFFSLSPFFSLCRSRGIARIARVPDFTNESLCFRSFIARDSRNAFRAFASKAFESRSKVEEEANSRMNGERQIRMRRI